MGSTRRKAMAAVLSGTALAAAATGQTGAKVKRVHSRRPRSGSEIPLYSEAVSYGDFVFISGHGVATPAGDVRVQTTKVLDTIQAALENAGSSMEKVVKCNVYLADINDYAAMNEVYRGRFGPEPPVRTTVAIAAIPLKDCLVEIDVIAAR